MPSFRGVPEAIAREARDWGDEAGKNFDEQFEKNAVAGAKKTGKKVSSELSKDLGKSGQEAGESYTGTFRTALTKGLAQAQRELNTTPLKLALNDDGLRKPLDKLRGDLASLDRKVKLGTDAAGAFIELNRLVERIGQVQKQAKNLEIGADLGAVYAGLSGVQARIRALSGSDIELGLKVNDRQLGAFERRLQSSIQAILSDLPELDLDDGPAQEKVLALREQLRGLERKIELGVDSAEAFTEIAEVAAALHELADTGETMKLRVDAAEAYNTAAGLKTYLETMSRQTIEVDLEVDKQAGAFERSIKSAISSALSDLGTVDVGATSNAGQRAVADLREQLFSLQDQTIGVDISAETFRAKLEQIRDELESIQREHWSVDLDANTAAATAKLTSYLAALEAIDGRHIETDVDVKDAVSAVTVIGGLEKAGLLAGRSMDDLAAKTRTASSASQDGANSFRAFNTRVLGVAALGPLVVPVLGGIAGGIAALLPLAATGGAALGVLALGLSGIGDAFKAMGAARDSSAKDMATYSKSVQSASQGVRDAEAGLASAREQASRAAEDSARRIADAEEGVAEARADAAQAAEDAAQRVADASRAVEDAERGVAEAQADRTKAQEDLTKAVRDAWEAQEDLALSLRDSRLDEEKAAIDLNKAQGKLADALAEGQGKRTDEEWSWTLRKLNYDVNKYALAIDTAKEKTGDLQAETDEFARTGIEGTDKVKDARERLADADKRVADAQRGVADAQRNLADAQTAQSRQAVESQKTIAAAERDLSDARKDAGRQAADSARAVAAAQQQVVDAMAGYGDALSETSTAADKLDESMAKLGPTGQAFVRFLDDLRPRFDLFRQLAQDGLLPGLASWIDSIVNDRGPQLERVVGGISGALGDMFARFATSIKGDAFGGLFTMLEQSGPRLVGYMGSSLLNLGEGFASLTEAFLPLSDLFGTWLIRTTDQFKDWAASINGTQALQDFFAWVERVGPKVGAFFWEFGDALVAIGIAVAPIAEGLLEGLTAAFSWIAEMDPQTLATIALGIIGVTLALQAIFGLTALANSFASAIRIVTEVLGKLGGSGGTLVAAGGQLGIFAGALAVLYTQSGLVRDVVNDVLGVFLDFGKWLGGAFGDLRELASILGIIAASWKAASVIGGGLGKLGTAATNAAPGFGVLAAQVTGSDKAGDKAMTTMGKFAGVLGKIGGALPIIGIAFGLVAAGMESADRKAQAQQAELDGWVNAMYSGGQKAQEAAKKVGEYRKNIDDLRTSLAAQEELLNNTSGEDIGAAQGYLATAEAIETQTKALEESEEKYRAYWASLTPIEQAQANLAAAQNDLTTAVRDHGRYSDEAKSAAERLAVAEGALEQIQYDVAAATSGLNAELQEQVTQMMALAEAELAYEQSVSGLEDAHKRSVDALAEFGANSKQYKDALLAEEQQMNSVAEAAGRVAAGRHTDADATTRQAFEQAAYLIELNRQKELYGELPPRLEAIRQGLEKSVDPAILMATKIDDLGLKVQQVPDSKTIIIDAPTQAQIDSLEALGLKVEEMPDGSFKVVAETAEAEAALAEIVKPKEVVITTRVTTARENQTGAYAPTLGSAGRNATGGHITGPGTGTSDSILSWLSNGEYVVKAAAVNKYGVGFFNAINDGALPGYARGGQVKRKKGLPAFADGGPVMAANWGGSISLSGGDLNPLAGMWFGALQQIQSLAGQAAGMISGAFTGMKDTALGLFRDTKDGALGHWGEMIGGMLGGSTGLAGGLAGIFGGIKGDTLARTGETNTGVAGIWTTLRDTLFGRASETRDNSNNIFTQMRDQLFGRASETRDNSNNIFGQMRDWLFGRSDETRDGVNTRMGQLRDGTDATIGDAVRRMLGHWGGLPGGLAGPVNTIIDAVLNNGLFKAFNSIVGALGLDVKLNIPTAEPVRIKTMLADGGRVPGSSPHSKADNIPAMLTAGEWVQPVDSVRYYGPEFMEAIRKKRLPREMFANPIYRADGGLVALGRRLQTMGAKVSRHSAFDGVTPTSGHGASSLHYTDNAIDVNTRPGTSALEQRELDPMAALAKSLGFRVIWRTKDHFNHLHIDTGNGNSIMGTIAGAVGSMISDPLGMLKKAVDDAMGTDFEKSGVTNIMGAAVRKLVDFMGEKVTGLLGSILPDGPDDKFGKVKLTGNAAGNEALAQQLAAGRGWVGPEWNALRELWMGESGFNNTAQNPTSTAYGIAQFLNSTWAGTGYAKTSDPRSQILAGFNYIANRYGTPTKANAFKRANNWYSEGGPVQPVDSATGAIVPDLHDTGGWLQPGLNVIMNRTGRPEPTINPQTLDALQTIAAGGGGGALIGAYHQTLVSNSPREAAEETVHAIRVLQTGGRYETVSA